MRKIAILALPLALVLFASYGFLLARARSYTYSSIFDASLHRRLPGTLLSFPHKGPVTVESTEIPDWTMIEGRCDFESARDWLEARNTAILVSKADGFMSSNYKLTQGEECHQVQYFEATSSGRKQVSAYVQPSGRFTVTVWGMSNR